MLKLRVLDLDGSLTVQSGIVPTATAAWIPARMWGPQIRLACTFGTFETIPPLARRCARER